MSDTPRTDFVAHESGDPEWNRFPNRFGRMLAHAQILERELAARCDELERVKDDFDTAIEQRDAARKGLK